MKKYKLTINGQKYETKVTEFSPTYAKVNVNGQEYYVEIEDEATPNVPKLERADKAIPIAPVLSSSFDAKSGEVRAPMPGVIFAVLIKEGDFVKAGTPIIILEAMKMESEISAPISGKIIKIHKKEKSLAQEGDILVTIEIDPASLETKQDKQPKARRLADKYESVSDNIIRAPMSGSILDVMVSQGDTITEDQTVLILEAMKMESEIHSHISGKVKRIVVQKGSVVQEGDALLELEV